MKDENKKTIPENADKSSVNPAVQPLKDEDLEGVSGGNVWDTVCEGYEEVMSYLSDAKTTLI